jgi:hypothetical protein
MITGNYIHHKAIYRDSLKLYIYPWHDTDFPAAQHLSAEIAVPEEAHHQRWRFPLNFPLNYSA